MPCSSPLEFLSPDLVPGIESPSEDSNASTGSTPRMKRECSISIMLLMLAPTSLLMLVVALVAWTMMYRTAHTAVHVLALRGQASFVSSTRKALLSYTNAIQNVHSVNRPTWLNTTVKDVANVSSFDPLDDVRITLLGQATTLTSSDTYGMALQVALPNGASLRYQRSSAGNRWSVYTGTEVYFFYGEAWNNSWRSGPASKHPPSTDPAAFNTTKAVWFQDAIHNKMQSWSSINYSATCASMSLPAVMPVYYPNGHLKLVALVQPCLKKFDATLSQMKPTPNAIAFVAETDGRLIASIPEGQATITVLHNDTIGRNVRKSVFDSVRPLARAALWITERFGSLSSLPPDDSQFIITLDDEPYILQTGHVRDNYGLWWIVVIGVPQSDLIGHLKQTTTHAMGALAAVLTISILAIGGVTWSIRRNLQAFARYIMFLGTMDLEKVPVMTKFVYLRELMPVLRSIQQARATLLEIRTFLPKPMLDCANDNREVMSWTCANQEMATPCTVPARLDDVELPEVTRPTSYPPSFNTRMPPHGPKPDHTFANFTNVQALFERHMDFANVSLLFVDLPELQRAVLVQLAPSDLMTWYDTCLSTVQAIAQKNAGDFYRLIGDQLLFMWGVVRRMANHCTRACHAACQISAEMKKLDTRRSAGPLRFRPHVSVVTGKVMCGVMGTSSMRDLHLMGTLVSQGARLARLNAQYETHVLVDSGVADQCDTMFKMKACGIVRTTGSSNAGLVYELLHSAEPSCPQDGEWMYQLIPAEVDIAQSTYMKALDFVRNGCITQATGCFEMVADLKPDDRHTHRWLKRLRDWAATGRSDINELID